jgi:hypothetical protein
MEISDRMAARPIATRSITRLVRRCCLTVGEAMTWEDTAEALLMAFEADRHHFVTSRRIEGASIPPNVEFPPHSNASNPLQIPVMREKGRNKSGTSAAWR